MLGKTIRAIEDLQPEKLKALGLDHVVLQLQNNMEIEAAIERCEEKGLKVAAIESAAGANVRERMELAKKANAIVLVREPSNLPELQAWSRELKVPVGIAVTNRYESQDPYTIRDMGMFLHKKGCSDLKLAVDTFDMNVEESSMEGALADWGLHICHIYLRDNQGGLPGTGIIDFDRILKTFETSCPHVPMTIEDGEEEALKATISYLKEGLTELKGGLAE